MTASQILRDETFGILKTSSSKRKRKDSSEEESVLLSVCSGNGSASKRNLKRWRKKLRKISYEAKRKFKPSSYHFLKKIENHPIRNDGGDPAVPEIKLKSQEDVPKRLSILELFGLNKALFS